MLSKNWWSSRYIGFLAVLLTLVVGIGLYVRSAAHAERTQTSPELEVELVTLRPFGFEPAEINRSKGPFVLFVDDRTNSEASSLILQRVTGERLQQVKTSRNKSEWNAVIDLPPGHYVMTTTANSEARCQITILP